jgi:hypothetical protein
MTAQQIIAVFALFESFLPPIITDYEEWADLNIDGKIILE